MFECTSVHSTTLGGAIDTGNSANGTSGVVSCLVLTTVHGKESFRISVCMCLGSEINKKEIGFYQQLIGLILTSSLGGEEKVSVS